MYIVMYVNHGYIVKREVYDIQEKARKVAAEYNRKPNLERDWTVAQVIRAM